MNSFTDALDSNTVARAVVTSGVVAVPNGGGQFTFGMNSKTNAAGVVGLVQRSPVGYTATTSSSLLTSIPIVGTSLIGCPRSTAWPTLMRVRTVRPTNCSGSAVRH